jgi:hypothetical protein
MPKEAVQTGCSASHWTDYTVTEALGENLSAVVSSTTNKASDGQEQFDPPARARQIGNHPRIATMHTTGGGSTVRASAILGSTIGGDDDRFAGCSDPQKLDRSQLEFPR